MKHQKYKRIAIIVMSILLIILIIYFYERPKLIMTTTYPISFNISESEIGINIRPELNFGIIPRSGLSTKHINITNDKTYALTIKNELKGNALFFIYVDKIINVPPKTNRIINVTLFTENATLGHYEGELIMKVYKGKK